MVNEMQDQPYYPSMMRWMTLLLLFGLGISAHGQSPLGLGCDFENIDTNRVLKAQFIGHRGALPSQYSLKSFAPMPGHQGSVGSCAAWSSAYAGLTIINGIENNNKQKAYSPWHLYNRVQTSLNRAPCQSGSTISAALNMLKTNGCLKFEEYNANCGAEPVTEKAPYDLYDFQALSISVTDFKKALSSNQPIVAAFKAYGNTGWELNENLTDGLWNGAYSGEPEGGHAMCIIGYDDKKGNGAFEVINSWGTSWGVGGYFWISYADISKHIKNAFTLLPHPEEESANSASVFGQKFEIHNDCYDPIYLALGIEQEGEWISKGWYPILANDIFTMDISTRSTNEIYWTAANHDMSIFWEDPESPLPFCIDPNQSFEFNEMTCDHKTGFFKALPKQGQTAYVLHLGCPTLQGRNSEVVQLADYNELIEDTRPKEQANQFWQSPFALHDLFTQRIIPSSMNDDGDPIFNIWLTDGEKEPENKIYLPQELEQDHRFKFMSTSSAKNWMAWKKEKK